LTVRHNGADDKRALSGLPYWHWPQKRLLMKSSS